MKISCDCFSLFSNGCWPTLMLVGSKRIIIMSTRNYCKVGVKFLNSIDIVRDNYWKMSDEKEKKLNILSILFIRVRGTGPAKYIITLLTNDLVTKQLIGRYYWLEIFYLQKNAVEINTVIREKWNFLSCLF